MKGLAGSLTGTGRSIVPTHPGFDGQDRPVWFERIGDLAVAYLALIERLELSDVVLVGNSAGGWIAAEMALRASPRISALVLIDAVGLDPSPSGGIIDTATLSRTELLAKSFYDPSRFAGNSADPDEEAAMLANQKCLLVYAGHPYMNDPSLRTRLDTLRLPTLVLWGENDRIVTPEYGRQFADLIADARFEVVPQAGHFPQLERLDVLTGIMESHLG